ncbi:MAG: hypothetical protein PHV63_00840 [Candidatus Daviesbacteria bacterium]|nr:hypothetical protein [Candidatus Daviesbacteria bacterium]
MILHINTKDQKVIKVEIRDKGKVISEMSEENEYGSQVLLPLIIKLLSHLSHVFNPGLQMQFQTGIVHVHWKDLDGIEVETGPGSFTGLRVGVSVANALGFALEIPVNGKKIETDLIY